MTLLYVDQVMVRFGGVMAVSGATFMARASGIILISTVLSVLTLSGLIVVLNIG